MNISRLRSLPEEARTSDPVLDECLTRLDSRLLGTAAVRLLTLLEVKDCLLERKARLLDAGGEVAAARAAVEAVGPLELVAEAQRAQRRSLFTSDSLRGGAFLAIGIALFTCVGYRQPIQQTIAESVLGGLLSGLSLGAWSAFMHAGRSLPSKGQSGMEYEVAYSKRMRLRFALMLGLFLLGAIAFSVGAVAAPDWMRWVLGALAVLDAAFTISLGLCVCTVDAAGLRFRRFLRNEQIPWAAFTEVGTLGERYGWLPSYWKGVPVVSYTASDGAKRSLAMFPDMNNADRLVSSIRERLDRTK